MSLDHIDLVAFPAEQDAEFRIQLGRLLPSVRIESILAQEHDYQPELHTLIFLWDDMTSPAVAKRIFDKQPQASIVVLTDRGQAERGADLIAMGVMDYRIVPCPDEVLEIYVRKSGHQTALAEQSRELQQKAPAKEHVFVTMDTETRRLLDRVALVAPSCASILVTGESGTGKERLARYIHACSNRSDNAFVAINCAAIPEGVLEAELFGHEKGAFTGATSARPGKFELAHQGTLLLDEITEMPVHLQAKLLRVLQEGEVDRLGGKRPVPVDVRVIATSNRDIARAVSEGQFRQDLFFRLNVVTIQLPPLRQRPADILPLCEHFLKRFANMYKRSIPEISKQALMTLQEYSWPGNVRELENCMHRAFLMCIDDTIEPEHLDLDATGFTQHVTAETEAGLKAGMSIREMERALIRKTLEHVQGNRNEAARLLGISIRTLRNKLNTYESGTAFAQDPMTDATRHAIAASGERS